MNPHPELESFLNWLLNHSLRSAFLVLVVLVVQRLFARQLTARWRFALWWLVLLHLLLPVRPPSPVSVSNWIEASMVVQGPRFADAPANPELFVQPSPSDSRQGSLPRRYLGEDATTPLSPQDPPIFETTPTEVAKGTGEPLETKAAPAVRTPAVRPISWSWDDLLLPGSILVWLLGVIGFGSALLWQTWRLRRRLQSAREVEDQALLELLERCRAEMGVRTRVKLVVTELIPSPALFGLLHPRLLLPAGLMERGFSPEELRFIFLHELAHLKRADLWINCLVAALQVLHWFNPLLWLGFSRMRADRELACDELALCRAGVEARTAYGQTIVKLLEGFRRAPVMPGMVGILEDQRLMRRRILSITRFRNPSRWSALASVILLAIGAVFLTDAQSKAPSVAPAAPVPLIEAAGVPAPGEPLALAPTMLDLAPFYHTNWSHPKYKGPGQAIPQGVQTFDGLPFQIGGQVGLFGRTLAARNQAWRDAAIGVPVGRAFDELHLLHHAFWQDVEGQPIAQVRLNYTDGTKQEFPIRFGVHVRDWFRLPSEAGEDISDRDTKIVWRGNHPGAERWKATVRLFKTVFTNPHPAKIVTSLDLVSEKQQASYSLIAATVASRDPERPRTLPVPPLESRPEFTGTIRVRVIDVETGAPLAGVLIDPGMTVDGAGVVAPQLRTSETGEATIRYPEGSVTSISVSAEHPGYSGAHVSWRNDDYPKEHVFRLRRFATVIGGKVQNEAGQPVAGAQISVSSYLSRNVKPPPAITDANGHWTLRALPAGEVDFTLTVEHPDYPTASFMSDQRDSRYIGDRVAWKELLSQTAVLKISRGIEIGGAVTGPDGNALTNARVFMGHSRYQRDPLRATVDARGQFTLRVPKPGKETITVQAGGHAPEMREIDITATNAPLQFTLAKGRLVKGRVVDGSGAPVPNARVVVETWRGKQTLEWQSQTDADGKFTWNAAPADAPEVSILKQGYATLRNVKFRADGNLETFTLPTQGVVSGTVLDAETKQPIAQFRATPGEQYNSGSDSYMWRDYRTATGREGKFELKLDEANRSYGIKIEAEGYLPVISSTITNREGTQTLTLELKRGKGPSGIVRLPNGQPAAGVQVAFAIEGQFLTLLGNRRLSDIGLERVPHMTTGGDGSFRFSPQPQSHVLVFVAEAGYAEVKREDFRPDMEIHLQPWGRIEGVVRQGKSPAVGEHVQLLPVSDDSTAFHYEQNRFRAKTDAEGRFVIENVPPGNQNVTRLFSQKNGGWRYSHTTRVQVRPGDTTMMTIGGTGRQLTGKVNMLNLEGAMDWENHSCSLISQMPKPPGPFKSREEYEVWRQTPEVKEATAKRRLYALMFKDDGSFQIGDVAPGTYDLHLHFPRSSGNETLAFHNREIIVPEGDADSPVDLGVIEVKANRDLKVGEIAPEFVTQTVDGRPLKLSDFRGKYVLLDFWATWCGPCVAELPHLQEAFTRHGADERFVMIGLSLDADAATPRDFAAKKDMKWTQGFLGEWSKTTVPADYGVMGIPATFLIGPDGRVLAKGLRGPAVAEAIANALPKTSASAK